MHVIRCVCWADGRACEWAGQYLKWYDPNLPIDQDLAEWTTNKAEAKQFTDMIAAGKEWKRVRTVNGGIRLDGKLDRPLTAFTVSIEKI